jgi:hypothetical protein
MAKARKNETPKATVFHGMVTVAPKMLDFFLQRLSGLQRVKQMSWFVVNQVQERNLLLALFMH